MATDTRFPPWGSPLCGPSCPCLLRQGISPVYPDTDPIPPKCSPEGEHYYVERGRLPTQSPPSSERTSTEIDYPNNPWSDEDKPEPEDDSPGENIPTMTEYDDIWRCDQHGSEMHHENGNFALCSTRSSSPCRINIGRRENYGFFTVSAEPSPITNELETNSEFSLRSDHPSDEACQDKFKKKKIDFAAGRKVGVVKRKKELNEVDGAKRMNVKAAGLRRSLAALPVRKWNDVQAGAWNWKLAVQLFTEGDSGAEADDEKEKKKKKKKKKKLEEGRTRRLPYYPSKRFKKRKVHKQQ